MHGAAAFLYSSAFCFFLSSIIASGTYAANGNLLWDPDGEAVGAGRFFAVASDGAGGAFVAWDLEPGVRVQHFDSGGLPQFGASGVTLSSTGGAPAITAEYPYGTTVAWEESGGIKVQRVDYSGTPLFATGGVQVATNGEVPVLVHVPGPTAFDPPGALIAWGELARVAHVDGSGSVTAPGVDGISLGGGVRLPGYMRMIRDGARGAFVVWADYAKNIVAQRVSSGLPWGATPTVISNDARDEGPLSLAPDGAGGALVSWVAKRLVPANAQIRVQRIDASGGSAWLGNGVVVVDSDVVGGHTTAWTQYELGSTVVSDGATGAIVAWNDWRNDPSALGEDEVYALRVDPSASLSWPANGVLLPPYTVGSTAPGSQRGPRAAPDGNGGAVITYQDLGGNSWDISATRVDAYGNKLFATWVLSDFGQEDATQQWPEIDFDGSGAAPAGAIVAWADQRSGQDVMVQKLEISGPPNDPSGSPTAVAMYTQSFGTTLAASQDGSSSCGLGGETDVWYQFVPPPWPGTLEVDTCGTHDAAGLDLGTDSVLSIHSGAPGTAGNELACNDDWVSGMPSNQCLLDDTGGTRDSATTAVLSGSPVWIRVSHYPGTTPGDFELNVRYVPEPDELLLLAGGLAGLAALTRSGRGRHPSPAEPGASR